MVTPPKSTDAARKTAQNHFTQSEQRDKLVKQEIEKARAASAAKTARLRALRMAKEAADKETADRKEAEKASAKAKPAVRAPKRMNRAPSS